VKKLGAAHVSFAVAAILAAGATPRPTTAVSPPASQTTRPITVDHLTYLGAFAYPAGDNWAYSGHALTYYPDGNPGGPADGFPGSLYAAAHSHNDRVGEMSIPAPVLTKSFSALPKATALRTPADITGGLLATTCAACASCDCANWDVSGLEYLPSVNRVAWNIFDWYNVGAEDLDSLGWSKLNLTSPAGVWHIGPRPNTTGNRPYHNGKTADYLLKAPTGFAADHLSGRWLITGYHREGGALGGSQGPTFFATAPWTDGSPPASGTNLGAQALVYYRWDYDCSENNDYAQCDFPGYRADDYWGGAAWVDTGASHGILLFGLKGLGDNCYGDPGVECPAPACDPYRGWHADPYEPRVLFYDPDHLAEVAAATRNPWKVLPYASHPLTAELFDPDCGRPSAVAYDEANHLIYVTEAAVGPFGQTAVHVWKVEDPLEVWVGEPDPEAARR
jgi:hypothetical protein